jgi:hypothetical protein
MRLFPRRHRQPLITRLYDRLARVLHAKDLHYALQLRAREEAVAYIGTHMRGAMICPRPSDLYRLAIERVEIEGLYLELGCKSGGSLREIALLTRATVHGFDSFEGLPEDWSGNVQRRGTFTTRGRRPRVPANVELHAGWFEDSLPVFAAAHPGPIAFMHVDCDLYSSTATALAALGAGIVPGTVLVFDEYFNYPSWQDHEYRAWQEFVAANAVAYDYLGFLARGGAVALKVRARRERGTPRS